MKYQPRGGYFTTVGGRTSTAFGRLVEESVLLRKANLKKGLEKGYAGEPSTAEAHGTAGTAGQKGTAGEKDTHCASGEILRSLIRLGGVFS